MINNRFIRAAFTVIVILLPVLSLAQPKWTIVEGLNPEFGYIYSNETIHRTLHIKNEGNDTLVVTGVSASCGCTTALASSDHIAPGVTAELGITFDPTKFDGAVKKSISFETNDPITPHAHLEFTAIIDKILTISEEYLVYSNAVPDSDATADLVLKNEGKFPISITKASATSELMTVTPSTAVINPDEELTFKCTLHPKARGIVKGNISIETNNKLVKSFNTRFYALVKAPKGAASTKQN